jgi:hypothetical protein
LRGVALAIDESATGRCTWVDGTHFFFGP